LGFGIWTLHAQLDRQLAAQSGETGILVVSQFRFLEEFQQEETERTEPTFFLRFLCFLLLD
jgi:hypothetical protein